jgi:hypothetical protein
MANHALTRVDSVPARTLQPPGLFPPEAPPIERKGVFGILSLPSRIAGGRHRKARGN